MNRTHRHNMQAILVAYFLTMFYATTYPAWGISELAIITCAISSCLCYQHKRTDNVRQRIKELDDAQKKITTDMQTLSSNMSSVANNVSTLASSMRTRTCQRSRVGQFDLQTAYDGTRTEEAHITPAQLQLPGTVPDTCLPPASVPRTHFYRRS